MRYKEVEFNGVTYDLRGGQTVEQLAALLPEYVECATLFGEIPIVENSHLILTSLGCLIDRSRRKRKHHKPRTSQDAKPRLGPGSGRPGGGRGAAHYRRPHGHIADGLVPPATRPIDCDICQHGIEHAMKARRKAYFDPWADTVLRQFPCLPEHLGDRFWNPAWPTPFITRWKALTDETKYRYLRFATYVDGVLQECWAREKAEREAARAQMKSDLSNVEI